MQTALSPTVRRLPLPDTRPARPSIFWHVELAVIGTNQVHAWRGWARDSQHATQRACDDARRTWPGWPLCVRNVMQVGA